MGAILGTHPVCGELCIQRHADQGFATIPMAILCNGTVLSTVKMLIMINHSVCATFSFSVQHAKAM